MPVITNSDAQGVVLQELELLRQRIIANMRTAGAVASGRTIASLRVVPTDGGAALVTTGRMPFGVLETGRRGGRVPQGFTQIIREWMAAKGIHAQRNGSQSQERADSSMAWAISRKIAREGTSLFRRGGRDTIYSQEIPKTIAAIDAKIGVLFDAYVDESIKLNNNEVGG